MTPNGARRPLTRGASRPLPSGRWTSRCARPPWRQPPLARGRCRTGQGRETAALTVPHGRAPGPPPAPRSERPPPGYPPAVAPPAARAAACAAAPPSHPETDTDRSRASQPMGSLAGRAPSLVGLLGQSQAIARPTVASRAREWLSACNSRQAPGSLW